MTGEVDCKHENAEYVTDGVSINGRRQELWSCPDCGRWIIKHGVSQENFISNEDDYTLVD
jgi:hypothetical protein